MPPPTGESLKHSFSDTASKPTQLWTAAEGPSVPPDGGTGVGQQDKALSAGGTTASTHPQVKERVHAGPSGPQMELELG